MGTDDVKSIIQIMELVRSCAAWKAEAETLRKENNFLKEQIIRLEERLDSSSK